MAANLVSYVMQFLTPDMVGRIAASLGLNREDAQTGIGAAVPALLAAFGSAAGKPGGAQGLADSVKQQSGVLDNLAGTLGGGNQSSLIESGTSALTSLLGGQDQSALAGAIGRYAGIGQGASGSLLGMLAPLVLGAIGKQLGTRNVDANSVSGLLASQKDQIAQALPGGMNRLLGGSGLLDSLTGAAGSTAAAAGEAGRTAAATAGEYSQSAPRRRRQIRRVDVDLLGDSAGIDRGAALVPLWRPHGSAGAAGPPDGAEHRCRRRRCRQAGQ
jgi:hypothetical protein